MNTQQVADRLVELCRQGRFEQAQDELYAEDAVSIEMDGMDGGALGNVEGLDAIREKGRRWMEGIDEIHGSQLSEPAVAADWFSLAMAIDVTFKEAGRVPMEEICVYQVRDGKIVREQFFYTAPAP